MRENFGVSLSRLTLRLIPIRSWLAGGALSDGEGDPAQSASAVFTAKQRLWLLLGFALLTMLRLPLAWFHGRFLGEEGAIFLAYAWHRPADVALWRSFAGYLNLGANAPTLAVAELVRSKALPLEVAPYFTMTVALMFQLVPAGLILTGKGRWLANRWAVLCSLLIIATSPMTEEVFANVLHIQFHLALTCALILALDMPDRAKTRAFYVLPLMLAPLCGPGAIVLLPLFALRTFFDRDKGRLMQTMALGSASALQMLVFYTRSPVRGHLLDPVTLVDIMFVRLAALPYISAPLASLLGRQVYIIYLHSGGWICAAAATAYFGWLLRAAFRRMDDAAPWLIMAALAIAAISFGAGMLQMAPREWFDPSAAQRYNFLPEVLLGLGLVALTMRSEDPGRRVFTTLCTLVIVSGLVTFFVPIKDMRSGPDWRLEVGLWRSNHTHMLATWPRKWLVDLSDKDRPCTSPISNSMRSKDPTYCESNWSALVVRDSKRASSTACSTTATAPLTGVTANDDAKSVPAASDTGHCDASNR